MLLGLVLLTIFTVSTVIYLWFEVYMMNTRLDGLEQKLNELEKEAIKVKFKKETI
jgi:hypothetical protein